MNWLKTIVTLGISTAVSAGLTVTVNPNARETAQRVLSHTQAAVETTLVQVEESANTFAADLSTQFGANVSVSSENEVILPPAVTVTTDTSADASSQAEAQGQSNSSETTNADADTAVNASTDVDASAALDSQTGLITNIGGVSVDAGVVADAASDTEATVDQNGASVSTEVAAGAAVDAASAVTTADAACDTNVFDSLSGWLGLKAQAEADSEAELKCSK